MTGKYFYNLRKITVILGITLSLFVFSATVLADQFAWVSKEEADKAVKLLQKHKQIKHFCAPCGDKTPMAEDIAKIEAVPLEDNYWQVEINGKGIDLAYVYFQTKKGKWKNLALELDLDATDVPEYLGKEPKKKN